MKRVHGCKYQHCKPELKKTTVGPAKDNHQASVLLRKHQCLYMQHTAILTAVKIDISVKKFDILIFAQNIDCGYTLESSIE